MITPEHRKRLYWHSRRGMLELDLILVPFVEQRLAQLTDDDLALFERLLACEDQDMFRWFLGAEVPEDQSLASIVELILQHARESKGSD